MIIGFTGTRFGMNTTQYRVLSVLLQNYKFEEVHHGDCEGADEEFHKLVWHNFTAKITVHPPELTSLRAYCKGDLILDPKPYEQRNRDIVQASDLIIAAPNTMTEQPRGGTWQTVRFSREYNKPCKIVLPNGVVVDA